MTFSVWPFSIRAVSSSRVISCSIGKYEMWADFVSSVGLSNDKSEDSYLPAYNNFLCFSLNSSSTGSKRTQRNQLVHHRSGHGHYTAICRSPLRLRTLWLPVETPPKRIWCRLSYQIFTERNVQQMLSAQQCSYQKNDVWRKTTPRECCHGYQWQFPPPEFRKLRYAGEDHKTMTRVIFP